MEKQKPSNNSTNNKNKVSRFSLQGPKTFKTIALSTLLIVLPFIFYWYVQIQNHQDYEQEKIYRTLRELELHINNEIQALKKIQDVLPPFNDLISFFKTSADTSQISGCSLKIIEGSRLYGLVETSGNPDSKCDWSAELLEEVRSIIKDIDESDSGELAETSRNLAGFLSFRDESLKESKLLIQESLKDLRLKLNAVCQSNKKFELDRYGLKCNDTEKIDEVSARINSAKEIKVVINSGHEIYLLCELRSEVKPREEQSKEVSGICEVYNQDFEELMDDFTDAEIFGYSNVPKNYTVLIEKTAQVLDTLFSTLEKVKKAVDKKIQAKELSAASDSTTGSRVVSTSKVPRLSSFNRRLLKPYEKLVSRSKICMFVSKKGYGFDKDSSIVSVDVLHHHFGEDVIECTKILEGNFALLYKTSWFDEWKAKKDNKAERNLWLAVGMNTIFKRYRSKLTYMEDIYLADNEGNIYTSFIGANKKTTTETLDSRIVNLKPVIREAFQGSKQKKAPENEQTGVVENDEIGIKLMIGGESVEVPSWSFQSSFLMEGSHYLAMVKPMLTILPRVDMATSFKSQNLKPLLLVGLKKSGQLDLFTDRLSPLFHLSVLFVALMLLLTMPVFHVALSRTHNSYTQFTVRLYSVALILSVIVSVIGVCSYLTMLKQNMFTAELLENSAETLLSDWNVERDAGIEYLQKAERCLFNKKTNGENTSCHPEFSEMTAYKNYSQQSNLKFGDEVDSFLYKSKNALPLMGLVFYTDKHGEKQKPDWMSRDFIPIKNENIDLSKREYFSAIQQFSAWKTITHSKAYYIERVYNYIDGRKVTQLSIPRNEKKYSQDGSFDGVVSGEIMALTFENPVLPPGVQFAVIESKTGKVLFHTEKERVLVENFYNELDKDGDFEQAVRMNSDAMETIFYRSKKILAYSQSIPDSGWSLILIHDSSPVHSLVNEIAISVIFVLLFILLLVSITRTIMIEISHYLKRKYKVVLDESGDGLSRLDRVVEIVMYPLRKKFEVSIITYLFIIFLMAATFSAFYNIFTTETGLILIWLYLFLHIVVLKKTSIKGRYQSLGTGLWVRTNPFILALFLLVWIGLPSVFLFGRWFDISSHQIQAYNYLEIKNNLEDRADFIRKYRNTLWYNDSAESKKHWLSDKQQMLGALIHTEENGEHSAVRYHEFQDNPIASRPNNFNVKVLEETISRENETQRIVSLQEEYCLNHQSKAGDEHDQVSENWRSLPPLGKLSKIAYNIDGQHCTSKDNEEKTPINVSSGNIGDVWGWDFSNEFSHQNNLHRITRLAQSESLLFMLMVGMVFVLFVYSRTLIKGIWSPRWFKESQHVQYKKHTNQTILRHRILIGPEQAFVKEVFSLGSNNSSFVSSKSGGIRQVSVDADNENGEVIDVYFDIDLVAMESRCRKILLDELERKVIDEKRLIWLLAEVPPLYRLLKSRAYPHDNEHLELTQAEVLRWANLFRRFYKDYDSAKLCNLEGLLKKPVLGPFSEEELPELIAEETDAFYPDLCWVGHVIRSQGIEIIDKEEIASMTSIYAGAYYRFKWEECTLDERTVLYQIASGRYPSSKNTEVIEHMLRRGYVVTDPFLRINNESFRLFILSAELQDTFDAWESQAEESGWQQMRIYVGVIILLILAWLAYTSKDTYQQVAYIVGSLLTVFTALTQGASLLKLGNGSSDSG